MYNIDFVSTSDCTLPRLRALVDAFYQLNRFLPVQDVKHWTCIYVLKSNKEISREWRE